MAASGIANSTFARTVAKRHGVLVPIATMCLLVVLLVPLPTTLLDFLLSINLTISAIVLLTVMYIGGPLEFSSFPSMLLGLTLFRLALNTASSRLILTNGESGVEAAGHVIAAFGQFVAGGSLMVGVIIFVILVIIQFVVITKGATRIAEVAARFTLDGMPGKQMAVDADLNAGVIDEQEAKRRRESITREADFYGAMDGASKFVRGDAIAGIVITIVNIFGGMYVGMVEDGMSFMQTLEVFTKLTIGDGLVSQIPAFIVSIAAAMLVTRSASKKNLGEELLGQMTSRPVALVMTAGFLVVLAATPLPKTPMLILAGSCAVLAFMLNQNKLQAVTASAEAAKVKSATPEKVEKFLGVDPMELEVGYGLIPLVDRKQGGDLLDRITNLRKQAAQDLGLVVPPIRIRDQLQLQANHYRIKLKGIEVARGEVMPGHLLAIDTGLVTERVPGFEAKDPAFGLPARWIDETSRHHAEQRNYTVVGPTSVLSTHITEVVKRHADELLTRQEVNRLVDTLKERSPKLVEELIPTVVKLGELQKVLQNLLKERVPIRDLEAILETVGDWIGRTRDTDLLTEYVRSTIARSICHQHKGRDGKLHCITLDPEIENLIHSHVEQRERGAFLALPPSLQNRIVQAVKASLDSAATKAKGDPLLVLCSPQVRSWVRRMIENALGSTAVVSFNEVVAGTELEAHGMAVLAPEASDGSATR